RPCRESRSSGSRAGCISATAGASSPGADGGEGLHRHVAGDRGHAGQSGQPVGVEVFVGGQIGDLDLKQVIVVAGDVVGVNHLGQLDHRTFEGDDVGAGVP